ncbi:hypothetical protein Acsp06_34980 [Actinomycetospora sp. NBRC 106375]|uniref:hypothetical protein n=1 Tax=Actinomycetospora sp. NBRC 106375 TaxID=3032207 RepID=UPI00249FFB62|nr:hypothetical protein [Actinomycetospora sp. NBRC 106375]GLZ47313.1 hypothetical protein Acsp06_34980 [Actinomycetospora sp. NBRC 106375]
MSSADGLLLVLSAPGDVPDEEFHRWYDTDHAPARAALPGVLGAERFRAVDGLEPGWLAVYPLRREALASPEYAALRVRSPAEAALVERLGALDRRVYARLDGAGPPAPGPAPLLLTVGLTGTDPGVLDAWYAEEHLELLAAVPGWRRATRFRRVEGDGPDRLAVHELDGPEVFATEEYRRAVTTPRRDGVMATVTARERRLFAHHRSISPPTG